MLASFYLGFSLGNQWTSIRLHAELPTETRAHPGGNFAPLQRTVPDAI